MNPISAIVLIFGVLYLSVWTTIRYLEKHLGRMKLTVVFGNKSIDCCSYTSYAFLGHVSELVLEGRDQIVLIDGDKVCPIKKNQLARLLSAEELKIVLTRLPSLRTICVVRNNEFIGKARQLRDYERNVADYARLHPESRVGEESRLNKDVFISPF